MEDMEIDMVHQSPQANREWSAEFAGLENVLCRLPIFCLQQSRTVCKAWNDVICRWSFRRLWSQVNNSSENSWILFVDKRFLTSSIVFYNVRTNEWHFRELNVRELLASKGYASHNWYLSRTTAKGLLLLFQKPFASSKLRILVLNPLTKSLRNVSTTLNMRLPSSITVDIFDHGAHEEPTDLAGQQFYKFVVLYSCKNVWKCLLYSSWNNRWKNVEWPPIPHLVHNFQSEDRSIYRKDHIFQKLRTVHTPGWVGRMFDYVVFISCLSDSRRNFWGCVDLISIPTEEDSPTRLRIPWSWNSKNRPGELLYLMQRNDSVVATFLEVTDAHAHQCLAININTLEIRYGDSDIHGNGDGGWHTKTVMPDELFKTLHCVDHNNCHMRRDCFGKMICFMDGGADQLLFFSRQTSQIVAYRFSPPSPDQVWVSLGYPSEHTLPHYRQLYEFLRWSSMEPLIGNFQFGPDSLQ